MKKLVVIKIGTSLLTSNDGVIKASFIADVCEDVAIIKNLGWDVIVVSSGAMASGKGRTHREICSMDERHLLATVGQPILMNYYNDFLRLQGIVSAQCLLTWNNFENEYEKKMLKENFEILLKNGVVPIVNENDFISNNELKGGDNDTMSAKVASLLKADTLCILSDVDGLYDKNPQEDTTAKRIERVEKITIEIWNCIGEKKSKNSLGGMKSKVEAAQMAMEAGVDVILFKGILGGHNIPKILSEKISVGTFFVGKK